MTKDMFLFIGLGTLFLIVSLGVYITKGENAYLLAKKLRIGALLITLSVSLGLVGCGGGGRSDEDDIVTCYAQPFTSIEIIFNEDVDSDEIIELDLSENNILTGTAYFGYNVSLKYKITQTDENGVVTEYGSGLFEPADGEFDGDIEAFTIMLDAYLMPGMYTLEIYEYNEAQEWWHSSFDLNILE